MGLTLKNMLYKLKDSLMFRVHFSFLLMCISACISIIVCVGVQMSNPAAGVACGLMLEKEPDSGSITRHTILADLSVSSR